jgi:alkylhydroperoxidase family enzyme
MSDLSRPNRAIRVPLDDNGRAIRDAQLYALLGEYQNTVVRSTHLDVVTQELIRLRCARQHDCRICQTLRLVDAQQSGVNADMESKIDFYETSDLSERHKTALRLVDAFIWRPQDMSDELVAQAHEYFSDAELAEILVDITKWSTQKIHVTLGIDGADHVQTDDRGVAYFVFADDGKVASISAKFE